MIRKTREVDIAMRVKIKEKKKKKRRRDKNHEAITDWTQSELNSEPLKCMMLHIMNNLASIYACFDLTTNSYC